MSMRCDRAVNALQMPNGNALSPRWHDGIFGRVTSPKTSEKAGADNGQLEHGFHPGNEALLHWMAWTTLRDANL